MSGKRPVTVEGQWRELRGKLGYVMGHPAYYQRWEDAWGEATAGPGGKVEKDWDPIKMFESEREVKDEG